MVFVIYEVDILSNLVFIVYFLALEQIESDAH